MTKQEFIAAATTTDGAENGSTEYTQRLSFEGMTIGSYLLGYFSNEIIDCINRWLISVKGINLDQLAEQLKAKENARTVQ